ncbi:MAG: hypothetical protein KatS3mg114_0295 [Planctomycetaceae bacterium]|nr:MAG: hypothetical protein KatS3mg114_0295 [Planctomycetaceae bacterium]
MVHPSRDAHSFALPEDDHRLKPWSSPRVMSDRASGTPSTTTRAVPPPRRLPWQKKLLFSLIVLGGLWGLTEFLLAWSGFPAYYEEVDPFLGFIPATPLFVRVGDEYVTNELKLAYFNPQRFPAVKPSQGRRIFVLGESTTFGHPYRDPQSYVNWLRTWLQLADPQATWEVINCGGISYASYRLLALLKEVLQYQPDVVIVQVGHNEFLEERTYQPLKQPAVWKRALWSWLSPSRIPTGLHRLARRVGAWSRTLASADQPLAEEVDAVLDHTAGPTSYHRDDALTQAVHAHYLWNLQQMCQRAQAAGVKIILIKPFCNLRDFAPFKSEYAEADFARQTQLDVLLGRAEQALRTGAADTARALLLEFVQQQPRHARGLYRLGQACMQQQDAQAQLWFERARDEDICPLRASSALEGIMSAVGEQFQVPVIDLAPLLAERARAASGCAAPGHESFLDHVHPTVEIHGELARECVRWLCRWGWLPLSEAEACAWQAKVAERIQATIDPIENGLALATVSQVLAWAGRDDEALHLAAEAASLAPQHIEVLAQWGRMLDKMGRVAEAREVFEKALALSPHDALLLYRRGVQELRAGNAAEAVRYLEAALSHTPRRAPRAHRLRLLDNLAEAHRQLGHEQRVHELRQLRAHQ